MNEQSFFKRIAKRTREQLSLFQYFIYGFILGIAALTAFPFSNITVSGILLLLFAIFSLMMTIQGCFSLFCMIYSWEDPKTIEDNKSPTSYASPQLSFTALIPARNEEHVIADTIRAVMRMKYPSHLHEALVICRTDDQKTIKKVTETIQRYRFRNCKLVLFDDYPINKPHSLNIGLKKASKQVVVVFDAEDEPHKDIYNIVNTVMLTTGTDVVQSGIQLMNFRSKWFSSLNVLEYYFWFKSNLQLFAKMGLIPLGGNTVFFKKQWLKKVHGWDETCLTEDADIGLRLSRKGAKIKIIYDEQHTTKEETPSSVKGFLKQRTRWNQGFLQVFMKMEWVHLATKKQKLLAIYILLWPIIQSVLLLYIPFSIFMLLQVKLPVGIALLSTIPFYLLILQLITYNIGLYEFTRGYRMKYPLLSPFVLALSYYPYQILLGISSLRAVYRLIAGNTSWEKTLHINAHRQLPSVDVIRV